MWGGHSGAHSGGTKVLSIKPLFCTVQVRQALHKCLEVRGRGRPRPKPLSPFANLPIGLLVYWVRVLVPGPVLAELWSGVVNPKPPLLPDVVYPACIPRLLLTIDCCLRRGLKGLPLPGVSHS